MSTNVQAAQARLTKARTHLVLDHPFFGCIALGLPWQFTTSIPTAATDGRRVLINPEFMATLDDDELLFLIAHECGHPMLEHTCRRQGRDPRKWNIAADYVLNGVLVDEELGKMPKCGLYDPALVAAAGGTTEGVYDRLPDDNSESGAGGKGKPLDDCQDAGDDPSEVAEQEAQWRATVAQAAQTARMYGKLSAGLARLVDSVLRPKIDWRDVLARFLVKCRTDERTFARPNRRFVAQGLYLPSVSGEQMGELVVAVDCSGSIDDRLIAQFGAEIRTIHEDTRPARLHVLYFDSSVTHVDVFERDDTVSVEPHGGGGTAFSPVFRYINEHDINPVAVVFLTDLACSDFGDAPDYPVLWVSTAKNGRTPFGEVCHV